MGDTKTKSSKRICTMPSTLAEEIKEYISSLYGVTPNTRIFPYTKKKLYSALEKGCKKSGVKRIEIHSIRHSNITLLENEIGSATTKAISSRCGHTNTKMTLHYAHIYEGTDQKIANELDEMMKERKNNKCQQKLFKGNYDRLLRRELKRTSLCEKRQGYRYNKWYQL